MIELDLPISILVAPFPSDVVVVASRLAAVVLLWFHDGVRALDIAIEIFIVALHAETERVVCIRLVAADETDIRRLAVVAQAVVLEVCDVTCKPCLDTCLRAVNGHDVALVPIDAELCLADGSRIGTQEYILIGEQAVGIGGAAPLDVELDNRFLSRLFCDDIDDTADGIRAVLRTRSALDDLNALDVLRAEAHHLVRCAVIFGKVTHNGLTVNEDECMTRLCTAD